MIYNNLDNNVGNNDFTDSVKIYYQELKKFQPISKERERELLLRAKNGDIQARNEIVTANLRFVFDIAKKYRGKGVDIADLIEEGNKGIIKAIEKFDMEKDVKFFTYAVWWIRQHMFQAIDDNVNPNEVNFDDVFTDDYKSIENVGTIEDEEETFVDDCCYDIKDNDAYTFENDEELTQRNFVVKKLLAKLDERERLVIMKYFGIEKDDGGHSLEEISTEMNLSTERVRQLKLKAINVMRAEAFSINDANFFFS